MVQKQVGGLLLVAGTCIGSGMIALPLVLAKLGLILSFVMMLGVWYIMYYTSLINLELNLQAGKGLSLGELAHYFSGIKAKFMGMISLKILSYALLCVYIYGGASIIQKLMTYIFNFSDYTLGTVLSLFSIFIFFLLSIPFVFLDYINRFLFIGLVGVIGLLVFGLAGAINWSHLPLFPPIMVSFSAWAAIIPVVFTSFGYQVIFHTLTTYCNHNALMLKRTFFWGSLIPALVYIIWTGSVVSVIYHDRPEFYAQMIQGSIEVGDLIKELSCMAKGQTIQLLVWWISLLAIVTSILGVGVGLCDAVQSMILKGKSTDEKGAQDQESKTAGFKSFGHKILSVFITVFPPYIASLLIPNAFVAVLGFAGLILAIIAILLPVYLFTERSKEWRLYYPVLRHKMGLILSFIFGIFVILCELYAMI